MMNAKDVKAALRAKLKASDLTEKDAALSKFETYTADEVTRKLPGLTAHPAAGFTLPYFDISGRATKFYRFRYLEQPPRSGFAALAKQKDLRYIQPAAAPPQLYFPKAPGLNWKKFFVLPPAENWLLITEGELKAACAAKHGFACIALGGVWNFKTKKDPVLKEVAALSWKDRMVYLVYDSDAASNLNVLAARNALAKQLLEIGAQVFTILLPALPHLNKTGLDDFIVAKSANAFEELRKNAEPWEPSRALHDLNEQVVVLGDSGEILELKTRQRMSAHIFKVVLYANRKYYEAKVAQGKPPKLVEKRTAAAWIEWPYRAQVSGLVYEPGAEAYVNSKLNTWRGWGIEPKKGDVRLWHRYMDCFFEKSRPEERKWFTQWLAYPLQHPGTKMFAAAIVWGPPGSGKSLLGHTMGRIYGENFKEIDEPTLVSNFNDWAENRQFVMGEELSGGNKRAHAELLKNYITSVSLTINAKYVKPYSLRNCIQFYFCSNNPDSFFLQNGERRYFVHQLRCGPLKERDPQLVSDYDRWYRSEAGAAGLFDYLLHVDLSDFDPKAPALETEERKHMIEDGRSEAEQWVADLEKDPDSVLIAAGSPVSRSMLTSKELLACFDPHSKSKLTANGLARILRRHSFRGEQLNVPGALASRPNVWIVRNREKLETMKATQLADIYCEELGIKRPPRAKWGEKKNAEMRSSFHDSSARIAASLVKEVSNLK